MDIVEFAEKICDFSLTDWQKNFLREAYEDCKNNKQSEIRPITTDKLQGLNSRIIIVDEWLNTV